MHRFVHMMCVAVTAAAAWGCSSSRPGSQQPQDAAPSEPEVSADLEPFLTSYFATWSAGDMDGYRDHFHPRATIYLVKSGQVLVAMPRDPFVEGQEETRGERGGVEKMTSFRAQEDRYAASVTADWELVEGDESTVGVDRFSLIRDEQWHWKIISLLFYSTAHGEAETDRGGAPTKRH